MALVVWSYAEARASRNWRTGCAQAAEVESEEAGEHEEHAVERVPGVGDEAFWATGGGGLYVRRGETQLRMTLGGEESKEGS